MKQSIGDLPPRRMSDAAPARRAPPRGWERCLACAAGAFTGAATVAVCGNRALEGALAGVHAWLAAGAPPDAERFEPLAPYPAWAVGAGVVVAIGGTCALAACLVRRGGRTAWFLGLPRRAPGARVGGVAVMGVSHRSGRWEALLALASGTFARPGTMALLVGCRVDLLPVRPPATLGVGDGYAACADGRLERRQLDPFPVEHERAAQASRERTPAQEKARSRE